MSELLVPFAYDYMLKAMWVSALVGGVCAFLSAYLMLKGWSLMGDALSHSIVPGVAGAYMLKLPYAVGAFFAGLLAALGMAIVRGRTRLREDAIIGLVFTAFFALGLLMVRRTLDRLGICGSDRQVAGKSGQRPVQLEIRFGQHEFLPSRRCCSAPALRRRRRKAASQAQSCRAKSRRSPKIASPGLDLAADRFLLAKCPAQCPEALCAPRQRCSTAHRR